MTNLLSHNGSVLPQWLALACEELRIFGNFRGVTSMTENFPDEIQDLIRVILDRKVTEDQTKCLVKVSIENRGIEMVYLTRTVFIRPSKDYYGMALSVCLSGRPQFLVNAIS